MSLTYRKFINKYIDLQTHDIERVRKEGELDGKKNIPPSKETEHSGGVLKILTDARFTWDKYLSAKKNYLSQIKKNLSTTEYEIDHNILAEIEKEQGNLENEQSLYTSKEGSGSAKHQKLQEELDSAKSYFEKLSSELSRPVLTKFEKYYIPFLLLLSTAEIPVNRKAFALFFHSQDWVLLILAIAVGAMLVFFAHTIGHLIREAGSDDSPKNLRLKQYLGISSISSVILILVYFLALMRQKLSNVQKISDTFEELMKNGPVQNMQEALFTSLGQDGIILLVLNMTIIAAGIIASFFRHDPHPYYEKVSINYNKLRDQQYKQKELTEIELNNIQGKFNKKLEHIKNREQNFYKQKDNFLMEIKAIEDNDKEDFKNVVNSVDILILAFQTANIASRTDKPPSFFNKSNTPKIREFLNK